MKVKIHHEGVNIIITLLLILLCLNGVLLWLCGWHWFSNLIAAASIVLFCLVINFFRLPPRHYKGERDGTVVSSVDGKVVAVEKVYEAEVLKREVMQVSVFMSILNVHANWVPLKGVVRVVRHEAGRFMAAWLPKSSTDNERSTIVIESSECGEEVLVRQIAGAVARRIVTYVEECESVDIDDFIGFIKFGSRVDIYLPLGSKILVKLGDKTTGGITPIAKLPKAGK